MVPDDMPFGCIHEDEYFERTPRSVSRDYNCYIRTKNSLPRMSYGLGQPYNAKRGGGTRCCDTAGIERRRVINSKVFPQRDGYIDF